MKKILLSLLLSGAVGIAGAAPSSVIQLWPEGVPGARTGLGPELNTNGYTSNVSEPTLTMVGPAVDHPNGTAVIICPGGGYVRLAMAREGEQYANWLSTLGVTTFILRSRMQEFGHPAPLQDVLRAVRTLRSRAAEFNINPARIGVMGSSAGGHLAASAGTLFDNPAGRTGAPLDATSARPDFLVLMYPVITMTEPAVHAGSRKALLGAAPSAEAMQLMSVEKQVTSATPPTLLIHTQEDNTVPVENSILFYQALTKAHVPAEMYLFEHGSHGMGMRDNLGTSSDWPRRAEEWLRARGLLTPEKKK